ncbi:MAG: hypothetical protein U1F43_20335 [Myxococcota bacterium]
MGTEMRAGGRLARAAVLPLVFGWSALAACSGDLGFHSDNGLDDMTCDSSGCWMCRGNDCTEYRCDATHQCPMHRSCSADNRCLPGDDGTGTTSCGSNADCDVGQICTLDGVCVTSPGGGPGADASNGDATGDTTGGDTATGDVGLPDHPDNVCLTNFDCGLDGTCVNGGCYFACAADSSCPPGQACQGGQCRPSGPENECTFNGECGASNHACVEGTCYSTCVETLDCPAHTRCSTGLCIADTTPVIQCSGPASCPADRSCVDGKCLEACQGACAVGYECKFNFCSPVAACFDTADCSGADCVNGACSAP